MQPRLVRVSYLDVTPQRPLGVAATVRGRVVDRLTSGGAPVRQVADLAGAGSRP